MYAAPNIGRIVLSKVIGSVFFIATAVIICIIKEKFNDKRIEKMDSRMLSNGTIQRKCQYCSERSQCSIGQRSQRAN